MRTIPGLLIAVLSQVVLISCQVCPKVKSCEIDRETVEGGWYQIRTPQEQYGRVPTICGHTLIEFNGGLILEDPEFFICFQNFDKFLF